ncbi:MAG: 50S ribosomal protein L22 [Candidatus Colwellbacteria bacterium CG10_big_fil_rev_8_21_14_0_10_41_28]|uniref:Large ribosomal subunit protein uL22 n=1 Tax=Candidatus Colwellbacteria bacterium CG10_big_fil_rev_8_21_14_0_10_41_28 TaxID=1974539 RepID=A0A2H0VJC1_9BACT|nr:MAG: 50S ribosomal protein L22 [Candidatus Colwellbacteria bacterium CG10_big_fil_rev_8_21_14_0_10_41_28]
MAKATTQLKEERSARASLRNLNVSPRKTRLVVDLVRGLSVPEAIVQLQVINKRASEPVEKLIRSAVANAREMGLNQGKLMIDHISVDKGRSLRRARFHGRGRVGIIQKEQSHINLVIKESDKVKEVDFVLPVKEKKVISSAPAPVKDDNKPKSEKDDTEKKIKKNKDKGFVDKFFRRKAI